jgi:hypothetical protein
MEKYFRIEFCGSSEGMCSKVGSLVLYSLYVYSTQGTFVLQSLATSAHVTWGEAEAFKCSVLKIQSLQRNSIKSQHLTDRHSIFLKAIERKVYTLCHYFPVIPALSWGKLKYRLKMTPSSSKSTVFRDVISCSLVNKVRRRFGGRNCLSRQGSILSLTSGIRTSLCFLPLLAGLALPTWKLWQSSTWRSQIERHISLWKTFNFSP